MGGFSDIVHHTLDEASSLLFPSSNSSNSKPPSNKKKRSGVLPSDEYEFRQLVSSIQNKRATRLKQKSTEYLNDVTEDAFHFICGVHYILSNESEHAKKEKNLLASRSPLSASELLIDAVNEISLHDALTMIHFILCRPLCVLLNNNARIPPNRFESKAIDSVGKFFAFTRLLLVPDIIEGKDKITARNQNRDRNKDRKKDRNRDRNTKAIKNNGTSVEIERKTTLRDGGIVFNIHLRYTQSNKNGTPRNPI